MRTTPMTSLDRIPSPTYAGLAADEFGMPDGRPPIVLLHGLTFDRTMWRPALAELQTIDPGRHAITLDLPGHGESPDASTYRARGDGRSCPRRDRRGRARRSHPGRALGQRLDRGHVRDTSPDTWDRPRRRRLPRRPVRGHAPIDGAGASRTRLRGRLVADLRAMHSGSTRSPQMSGRSSR